MTFVISKIKIIGEYENIKFFYRDSFEENCFKLNKAISFYDWIKESFIEDNFKVRNAYLYLTNFCKKKLDESMKKILRIIDKNFDEKKIKKSIKSLKENYDLESINKAYNFGVIIVNNIVKFNSFDEISWKKVNWGILNEIIFGDIISDNEFYIISKNVSPIQAFKKLSKKYNLIFDVMIASDDFKNVEEIIIVNDTMKYVMSSNPVVISQNNNCKVLLQNESTYIGQNIWEECNDMNVA